MTIRLRYAFLIGVILTSIDLLGQGSNNPFYHDTITVMTEKCRKEIDQATLDFEKKVFVIELEVSVPFNDTQQRVLHETYGIEVSYSSRLLSPNHDCYNFHLKTLVKEKWKHDVFKKSKSIADSLDKSGLGDRDLQFRTGHDNFSNFIKTNLSPGTVRMLSKQKVKTLDVKVDISETGDAENIEILNSAHFGDVEIEMLNLLRGKQLWIPKTDNGIGAKTQIIYPLKVGDW